MLHAPGLGLLEMIAITKSLLLSLLFISSVALAQDIFYVFTDKHGRTIMQDNLPPEYINKGYRIVNASGVTLKVVEPKQTHKRSSKKSSNHVGLDDQDIILLQTYASVREIELIREKRVASIEDIIKVTQQHNESFLRNLTNLLTHEAELRGKNEAIPERLQLDIQDVKKQIATNNEYIQRKRDEQRDLRDKFNRDIDRFRALQARIKP